MEILREYFKMMDIEYDEDMIRKFQEYMDGVLEYNEHVNLTAITNLREFIVKHYIDSVDIYKLEEYIGIETLGEEALYKDRGITEELPKSKAVQNEQQR